MGSLRQDLLAAAEAAVCSDLLVRPPYGEHPGRYAVVLGGSAVTDDADEYSGCDLFVFDLDGPTTAVQRAWTAVRRGPHPYRFTHLTPRAFAAAVARGDDEALHLLRFGQVLHDPQRQIHALWAELGEPGATLWRHKLAERYHAFRQRRASLAWSLRRGQPIGVLDNVRLLLEHALSCCYYLEGLPAPSPKWIFRGGLRTRAGRALRTPVLELLSALGDLATLGGSLQLHKNRIYRHIDRLQQALEEALAEAGLPVPGLAAEAGPSPTDTLAATPGERAPRARTGRIAPRHRAEGPA